MLRRLESRSPEGFRPRHAPLCSHAEKNGVFPSLTMLYRRVLCPLICIATRLGIASGPRFLEEIPPLGGIEDFLQRANDNVVDFLWSKPLILQETFLLSNSGFQTPAGLDAPGPPPPGEGPLGAVHV